MKGSRFSEEQIIGVLREHEAGAKTEEVCRRQSPNRESFFGIRELSRRIRETRRASGAARNHLFPGDAFSRELRGPFNATGSKFP